MPDIDIPALATASQLSEFRGAPFPEETVRAAGEQIRVLCGWHIAPEVTSTLVLDSPGGIVLRLPTGHVTEVTEVTDLTGTEERALTGWRWSAHGMLSRPGGFPSGFRAVRVVMTHGYPTCPPDLLAVLANRTQRRVMQESLGSRSVTYSAEGDRALEDSLARRRIGPSA